MKIEYPRPWYKGLGLRLGPSPCPCCFWWGGGALLPGLRLGRAQQQVLGKEIVPANYVHGLYRYATDILFATRFRISSWARMPGW